jgi:cyclopropane fatty-acyl-phospholipid synthase-like methyltransferase
VIQDPDLARVVAYYDSTWFDYRALWLNPTTRAIHFGWWGDGAANHAESLLAMNRFMASSVGVGHGDRVLDAGCGVGGTAMWLAQEIGARVVGITPVPDQVDRARRYAAERVLGDRVHFEVGDYRATGLPDGTFDVVWAQESLCHVADKDRFFAEAWRVLRPGGRLVVAEYLRRSRPLPPEDEPLLHSWLSGWAIPDVATPGELGTWARDAGFADVEVRDVTWGVVRSLRRLHRLAAGLYPVAALLRAVRLRDAAAHGNIVGARAQWQAVLRGLWTYGLITARRPT